MFKGSGFYETDYRSESYKNDAKAAKESLKPKKDDKKKSNNSKKSSKGTASS